MDLTHRFTLATTVDNAWATFNRLERLEPCFPGASITDITGDAFTGLVRIKLGPIGLVYEGQGRYLKRDERHHRLVLEASGKDKRGYSDGSVKVTATFSPEGDQTAVEVHSEITLSGRPAQLGAGVIEDASHRLLEQFVGCMSARFAGGLEGGTEGDFVPRPGSGAPTEATVVTLEPHHPGRRTEDADRLDLAYLAGPAMIKRYLLPGLAVAAVLVGLSVIFRRSRS